MARQYGILVDIDSCIGCGICVMACKQENNLPPRADDIPGTMGLAWNQVAQIVEGKYPDVSIEYIYVQCMHCTYPPCVDSCPEGAIFKRGDGIVLIEASKCNACLDQPGKVKKCISACPYGAIQFSKEKKIVQACTLCVHRVEAGIEPACVLACEGACLAFGDLNDPNSDVSIKSRKAGDRVFVLGPEKGTVPSVRYIKPRKAGKDKTYCVDKAEILFGFRNAKQ